MRRNFITLFLFLILFFNKKFLILHIAWKLCKSHERTTHQGAHIYTSDFVEKHRNNGVYMCGCNNSIVARVHVNMVAH